MPYKTRILFKMPCRIGRLFLHCVFSYDLSDRNYFEMSGHIHYKGRVFPYFSFVFVVPEKKIV